jgi:hypothetical protein
MAADAPTDPFFDLLTDALRAGPGSPQWRDAVAALRQKGADDSDEYRLLIRTRENLESGREYRGVRAGAGFTRKVMDRLGEPQDDGRQTLPIANIVAVLCALGIIVAIGYVIYRVASPTAEPDQQAIQQLIDESTHFLTDIADAQFAGVPPQGWKQIGQLPLSFDGAMTPSAQVKDQGSGVYYETPIVAPPSFMAEAMVDAPKPTDAVWVQVFVSADANFSADRATSSQELVWTLQGSRQSVAVNGNVKPAATKPPTGQFPVRLLMNGNLAVVEVGQRKPDGKIEFTRVWAGAHHLSGNTRYVGVRFLCTRAATDPPPAIASVKIAR